MPGTLGMYFPENSSTFHWRYMTSGPTPVPKVDPRAHSKVLADISICNGIQKCVCPPENFSKQQYSITNMTLFLFERLRQQQFFFSLLLRWNLMDYPRLEK
jgi:hypothetical protein